MAVLDAQGTVISFADNLSAAQTVGGVTSFSFGGGGAADIDVSTLASVAKEYRAGLVDQGDLTLEVQRDPNDIGQSTIEASAGAVREVVITLPGGDIATFNAYVKSISNEGSVDGTLTGTITLKVTGAIAWT